MLGFKLDYDGCDAPYDQERLGAHQMVLWLLHGPPNFPRAIKHVETCHKPLFPSEPNRGLSDLTASPPGRMW